MSGNRPTVSTGTSERKEALRTVEEESTRLKKLLCSSDIWCRYNYTATCFRLWMQTGISVSWVGSYLQVHKLDSSREEELCMSKISIPWSPGGNVKLQHECEDSIINKFAELSRGWLSINSKLQESRFASRICNRHKFHLRVSVIHTDTFCTLLLLHLWQDICVPIFLHRSTPWHFDKKHSKEEDAKQETNITKLLEELNERLQLRNKSPSHFVQEVSQAESSAQIFFTSTSLQFCFMLQPSACWNVHPASHHHTMQFGTLSSPLPLQSTPRLDTKSVIELPCARTSSTSDCWIKVQNLHQGHQSCHKLSCNDIKNTTLIMNQSPSNASNGNWWEPVLKFCGG
jgi:hypothetical protein